MPKRLSLILAAAAALAVFTAAAAQPSVATLLPATTVLAVHLSPEGVDTSTLESLLADLDLDRAAQAARKLAALIEEADLAPSSGEDAPGPFTDLAAECPELADAVREDAFGPVVVGVSVSRFDPMPDLVAAARPAEPEAAARLVEAAVACLDGTVLGSEGGAELHLLADGSDMPLVMAAAEGFVVVATDPDLVRGALRRARGAGEPGFASTRLGSISGSMTDSGLGVTLDLAAAADALELYRGVLGEAPQAGPVLDRFVTTLRVLGGFAWHVTVDGGGVVVESVTAFDQRLAAAAGEDELLALLTCEGCEPTVPDLLPRDAVALSGGVYRVGALVDWLETWFADLREAGLVDADLRGTLEGALGVDLDDALLAWVGDSWHTAVLEVLGTDARTWLQGLPAVVAVPVSSEDAARRGVGLWLEALGNLGEMGELLAEDAGAPDELRLDGVVAVRERSYRGVGYLRLRAGPTFDLGVAVFGGHLVLGWPAASLHAAVDAYLGSYVPAGVAWRTYESLGIEGTGVTGYRLVDAPAFLRGLARVADLAAGPVATAAWLAAQGAAAGLAQDDAPGLPAEDLLTYDELIALADVVTEALEALADRTGVAVGTTELRNGARWTTWRLPLR